MTCGTGYRSKANFKQLNSILPDQVYLRAHSTLREDMREWRSALKALFEATPLAARMLLALASSENIAAFSLALGLGGHMRELSGQFLEVFIARNEHVRDPSLKFVIFLIIFTCKCWVIPGSLHRPQRAFAGPVNLEHVTLLMMLWYGGFWAVFGISVACSERVQLTLGHATFLIRLCAAVDVLN